MRAGRWRAGVREGHWRSSSSTSGGSPSSTSASARSRADRRAVVSRSTAPTPAGGARELGDVVICLEHTADVREAIVHGVLHLVGMDHETDEGEMLALQRELLALGDS